LKPEWISFVTKADSAPRAEARSASVLYFWIPNDGEYIGVILAGSFAQVGKELAAPEFRCRQGQLDIFGFRFLADFDPGCSDLDVLNRRDAKVGLLFVLLIRVRPDFEGGAN
jgi:hypothetical protein